MTFDIGIDSGGAGACPAKICGPWAVNDESMAGLFLLLQAALASKPCGDAFASCEDCRSAGCLWHGGVRPRQL